MSFKEIESNHIKIKTWKDHVLQSMLKKSQEMERCQGLLFMLMASFLFVYHFVFKSCIAISGLIHNPKTEFKKLCRNEVFQEFAMYAGTALMFLGVYFIGVKYPDLIEFNWNSKQEYVADNNANIHVIVSDSQKPNNETLKKTSDQELSDTYKAMHDANPDFDAWISIEGTDIDYPVMYTPQDPEKYLHKDFYGVESFDGLPFIDARCREITDCSDNTIIYGHNMKDGSMFGTLTDFENEEYCKEHPTIRIDTAAGEADYDIMAVFYDRVYYADEDVFKFYNFIDAADEKSYDDAVEQYMDKSLYNTGVTAKYGDKLITLVTCTYQTDNGRFVVIARIAQGERL